jgi:hypothetical protein
MLQEIVLLMKPSIPFVEAVIQERIGKAEMLATCIRSAFGNMGCIPEA